MSSLILSSQSRSDFRTIPIRFLRADARSFAFASLSPLFPAQLAGLFDHLLKLANAIDVAVSIRQSGDQIG